MPRRSARWMAAEMPSEVLISRWGRNEIQNFSDARLMTSAASRYALAYTGIDTRDLRDPPLEADIAPKCLLRSRAFVPVFARWDRRWVAVHDPRRQVRPGFP